MNAYKYNAETGEYLGVVECQLDPLETEAQEKDVYLTPGSCTLDEPPAQDGYAAVYNNGAWSLVEDHRGEMYWTADQHHGDQPQEMKDLGPLPEGATTTEPAETLAEAKAAKIFELKSIRDSKEVEDITTDKGVFDYDDKSRDRLAIARQALTDAGGAETIVWTTADNQRVEMTVADFASINAAAAARSNELHITYNELKDRVNSCATVDEVNAIVWEG